MAIIVDPWASDRNWDIIYADPPWSYRNMENLCKTSLITDKKHTHYRPMSEAALGKLRVDKIAEKDSLLFLWTISPDLPLALRTMSAWGFSYSTVAFVWHKDRLNPGSYTMSSCELCLVGKRGRIPQPRGARNVRQFVESPRRKHSRKPSRVRDRITQMFPTQAKIELFATEPAQGWDAWGLELGCEPWSS